MKHLGPQLKEDHPDLVVMAFDHNKDHVEHWTKTMYESQRGQEYVDGIAFHWFVRCRLHPLPAPDGATACS